MVEPDAGAGTASGFIADAAGARWAYVGALTFANADLVLTAARALALPREGVVGCEGIDTFDSAAVAVLLAVKRRAAADGQRLLFVGLPARLEALATLYGVEEILAV